MNVESSEIARVFQTSLGVHNISLSVGIEHFTHLNCDHYLQLEYQILPSDELKSSEELS